MKQFSIYCTCLTLMLLLVSGCGQKQKQTPHIPKQAQESQEELPIDTNAFSYKKIEKLTFQEAEQARRYYEKNNNQHMLIKTLEHMISLATNHAESEPLIYRLAELEEERGNFVTAHNLYNNFTTLYPGSTKAEHAEYKAIETMYKATLDEFRDQSNTEKVIELGSIFIEKYPDKKDLIVGVKTMVKACRLKLLESELNRLNFYLHKYAYTNAAPTLSSIYKRLTHIKENIIPGMQESEPELKAIGEKIIEKEKEEITPELYESWKAIACDLDTFIRNKKRAQGVYKHPRFLF